MPGDTGHSRWSVKQSGRTWGSQLSCTINLRPKRAFSRAATFWARRMAAMALRVKSDEGRRLLRGSDFGLATDRFILEWIYNLFFVTYPAGNQSRWVSRSIEEQRLIGQGKITAEEIDQAGNKPPPHIGGRNIVAAFETSLPDASQ